MTYLIFENLVSFVSIFESHEFITTNHNIPYMVTYFLPYISMEILLILGLKKIINFVIFTKDLYIFMVI